MTPIAQVEASARNHKMSYGNYVALYNPDTAKIEEERRIFRLYVKKIKCIPPKRCAFCSALIEHPKSEKTKYCSNNCRSKARYYKRKNAHQDENPDEQ